LGKSPGSYATSLCGRNEIQVVPGKASAIDFVRTAHNLSGLGNVNYNKYMLNFNDGRVSIKLFKDGRAIVQNAKDINHAKAIYTEYFGM
jgi:adenylyltransferase/sulfurtransferase